MARDTNIVPAADDLAGWKAVERILGKRISDRIDASGLVTEALFRQYFGSKRAEYLAKEYECMSVIHAFMEWLAYDYRPVLRSDKKRRKDKTRRPKGVRRGKTLAEKMLAAGLPAAESRLLEACMQANPSLFRIISVESGSYEVVEDILLGGEYVIHDKMLSECVQAGQFLTGRVFPAGQFHFFSPTGPPLSHLLVTEAADYLESVGMEFSREGLRRGADKFGLLWKWYDKRSRESHVPILRNTDGEDLIWQTASFSVSDEKTVREALAQREDIEYDQEEDEYKWLRHQTGRSMIAGDMLYLGRMHFVLNELIIEVNSAERLQTARRWLEKIPGVKYLNVKSRDFNQGEFDMPLDDRMGPKKTVEITPELASCLQEFFNRHYMGWLDSPLPMLDGKTPRQMCLSEAGRQKVATLIRTIPTPVGNPGVKIDIPRQQMLRELGLESE
ncbi:MAG: DUF2384 domain-containing protein [Sedimentisphaerales bacterium]|nr:DUF2384 domain-containing protein [Sedimentisphaerales bacterium]